nr:reverse transcriptase domain, reverse transcriptase zinc-binding domain protein [Tanacetum cinerariifolium]
MNVLKTAEKYVLKRVSVSEPPFKLADWTEGIVNADTNQEGFFTEHQHPPIEKTEVRKEDSNSISKPPGFEGYKSNSNLFSTGGNRQSPKQPSHFSSAPVKSTRVSKSQSKSLNNHGSMIEAFVSHIEMGKVLGYDMEGNWIASHTHCFMINVYAPQEDRKKETLWNKILEFMNNNQGHYIIFGDFNMVRYASERIDAQTREKENLIKKINDFDANIATRYVDLSVDAQRSSWIDNLRNIDLKENLDSSQKAKIKWGIEADENSKFFHAIVNQKRRYLSIQGIKLEGHWIEDPLGIKDAFLTFFEQKFQKVDAVKIVNRSPFYKSLNDEQNIFLASSVIESEIKYAIWDCGSDKSPGSDGFSFAFYKEFWDMFKSDVVEFVHHFFSTSILPRGCNTSFITLIPKVPNSMIKWISGCLYSASSSILINGSPTRELNIHRGLRQGDPLSPFLFIIAMEGLHVAMEDAMAAGIYKGFNINTLNLSHLFFADDGLFIGDWIPLLISSLKDYPIGKPRSFPSEVDPLSLPRDDKSKKISWISWNLALASKEKGGLSIGSLFSLNHALIQKWHWRFINNPHALWSRLIVAIRGPNKDTSSFFSHVKSKGVWSRIVGSINIMHGKGFIPHSSIQRRFNNGASTKFWHDTWVGISSFKHQFPRLFRLAMNRDCLVRDCWNNGWHFEWTRNVLSGSNANHMASLHNTLSAISLNDSEDAWVWSIGTPFFTVKSARGQIDNGFLPDGGLETRWNRFLPNKINIFIWRTLRDRLPSRWNLNRKGIDVASITFVAYRVVRETFLITTIHVKDQVQGIRVTCRISEVTKGGGKRVNESLNHCG